MEIRFANKNDLATVVDLARAMVDAHHDIDPYYISGSEHKTLANDFANLLNDRNTMLAVAEVNDKIIGYINVSVERIEYINPKKIGVINNTYIIPQYRHNGVAQTLYKFAEDWLRNKKKIAWVELNADSRNKNATALWDKLGFTTYKFRMRKKLNN